MFIGTDHRYHFNFKYRHADLDFSRKLDVLNHYMDYWGRPCHAFLWINVNPFCGQDGSDFSSQRVSGAPHFFLCGARSGKGDYA